MPRHKVDLMYLGVDTEYNYPVATEAATKERISLRDKLGFKEEDIVCICTGKFTEEKKVFLLAESVRQLNAKGAHFEPCSLEMDPKGQISRNTRLPQLSTSCRSRSWDNTIALPI